MDLLETFKTAGLPEDMADTSKATAVAKLRCFLRTAYRRDWIKESLVDKVTSHRAVYEQKEPYSDDEVKKILDQALELRWRNSRIRKATEDVSAIAGTDA